MVNVNLPSFFFNFFLKDTLKKLQTFIHETPSPKGRAKREEFTRTKLSGFTWCPFFPTITDIKDRKDNPF